MSATLAVLATPTVSDRPCETLPYCAMRAQRASRAGGLCTVPFAIGEILRREGGCGGSVLPIGEASLDIPGERLAGRCATACRTAARRAAGHVPGAVVARRVATTHARRGVQMGATAIGIAAQRVGMLTYGTSMHMAPLAPLTHPF